MEIILLEYVKLKKIEKVEYGFCYMLLLILLILLLIFWFFSVFFF